MGRTKTEPSAGSTLNDLLRPPPSPPDARVWLRRVSRLPRALSTITRSQRPEVTGSIPVRSTELGVARIVWLTCGFSRGRCPARRGEFRGGPVRITGRTMTDQIVGRESELGLLFTFIERRVEAPAGLV